MEETICILSHVRVCSVSQSVGRSVSQSVSLSLSLSLSIYIYIYRYKMIDFEKKKKKKSVPDTKRQQIILTQNLAEKNARKKIKGRE